MALRQHDDRMLRLARGYLSEKQERKAARTGLPKRTSGNSVGRPLKGQRSPALWCASGIDTRY